MLGTGKCWYLEWFQVHGWKTFLRNCCKCLVKVSVSEINCPKINKHTVSHTVVLNSILASPQIIETPHLQHSATIGGTSV
jgi:hypothetical protein